MIRTLFGACFAFAVSQDVPARPQPTRAPLHRVVELTVGESREVELAGSRVTVKLLDVEETRDPLRSAVRAARVKVSVGGAEAWLRCANYTLPTTVGGVQVDCPITKGYYSNSPVDRWGLASDKDARLRVWPAGSPLLEPGTFAYPIHQRWFASDTQMTNEPVFVDGVDHPSAKKIYYHSGLDFSASEGRVEILSAVDGLVLSAGKEGLPGYEKTPVEPRYDVVYLLDDRGWIYWYAHLKTLDVRPGQKVRRGQKIGLVGKEGGSGGCSHLHFEIKSLQPSGKWGTEEAYAFVWEAYRRHYAPPLLAVARPHQVGLAGQDVTLDGTRSWSASGTIARHEWTFTDGSKAEGSTVRRTYSAPGHYSEVLKVTDDQGNVDLDFVTVIVFDKDNPRTQPAINPNYHPTFNLQPGDPVTFAVRSFSTTPEGETWDFGDGSPPVTVRSDANAKPHAPDGYAETVHRYAKPGHYRVRVEHTAKSGAKAIGHLQVRVGEKK